MPKNLTLLSAGCLLLAASASAQDWRGSGAPPPGYVVPPALGAKLTPEQRAANQAARQAAADQRAIEAHAHREAAAAQDREEARVRVGQVRDASERRQPRR